jgi:hypothetical protein
MKHLPARDALNSYRQQSPDWVGEQAKDFLSLSQAEQAELLFYMVIHLTQALAKVGDEVDVEIIELGSSEARN